MTTITLPRAVVEQTLNALDAFSWEQVDAARIALRAALAQQAQQAEPVEPVATVAENATTQQRVVETPPSDYRRGYWDGFNIGKREGRIEAEDALAQQAEAVEPVDLVSLLREADEIVRGKPTWKRFIDGTPLSNDIAVWMTVFAQDVARRAAPPQRKPLTDEDIDRIDACIDKFTPLREGKRLFARAVERAHGIKE